MKKISVLMATVFIDMLGFAMVFPLLPYYAQRFGAEPWVIGWMIASFSVAQIVSAPLWGRVSDRYGRRPAVLIGLAFSGLGFLIFGLANSVAMLFLSRIVQGAGGGTTGVAQAYVGDAMPVAERGKSLGWLSAASSAGVMLGPAIGSIAIAGGHALPGMIAATLCALNVAFAWRWLPEPERRTSATAAPPRRLWTVIVDLVRRPGTELARLMWIYAVGMLGFMSVTAVTALYLEARFGITERTIGLFFLYIGAVSIVMRGFLLGRLMDRFGETRLLRGGAALLAIGIFALPLPGWAIGFGLVMTLMPVGTACLFPATSSLVSQRAPAGELGQVMGVQQAIGGVARVVAPIWATAVFQGWGAAVPFYIAALVVAAASAMALGITAPEPEVPEPVACEG